MQDTTPQSPRPFQEYLARNSFGIIVVDILIAVSTIAALYYVFLVNTENDYKVVAGILIVFIILPCLVIKINTRESPEINGSGITTLFLLNKEGEKIKEWHLQGKTSLLIGKSTEKCEVDVDLSGVEFAAQISRQHAVLNYAQGCWYIEDIGSTSGIGIERITNDLKIDLSNEKPYRIEAGDVIYIADAQLLVE